MHLEHTGHKCCGGWNEQNEQNERNEQYRKIQRKETPTISEELFHLFWENKRFVLEAAKMNYARLEAEIAIFVIEF